jgi:hypothetical protein
MLVPIPIVCFARLGIGIDLKKPAYIPPALRAIASGSALIFIGAPRPAGLRIVRVIRVVAPASALL